MSPRILEGNLGGNPNETLQKILLPRSPSELPVFWRSLNCCEPICLLVPTPGLSSPPFLEPTGLAEGTVAAWEGFYLSLHFLSLQGLLSPWDNCGASPCPCPILCSASPEHLNLFHGQPKGRELLHLFCLQLFHSHGCQPPGLETLGVWRTFLIHQGGKSWVSIHLP